MHRADPESELRQAAALPSQRHQEQRAAATACEEEEGEGARVTYICVSPRLLRIMGHPFESSGGTWIWIYKTLFAMYFVIWGSYWRQSKSNSKRLTKISSQISLFSHFVK